VAELDERGAVVLEHGGGGRVGGPGVDCCVGEGEGDEGLEHGGVLLAVVEIVCEGWGGDIGAEIVGGGFGA
jgi:hypothetical protein